MTVPLMPAAQSAPAGNGSAFWDDAFALAQDMRCASDELVADRWERMIQTYPDSWMQWLSDQVGSVSDQGVVRRIYAHDSLAVAERLVAQVPPLVLRAIATRLARTIPDLDGIELAAGEVSHELAVALARRLEAALDGRKVGNLLDRMTCEVARKHHAEGSATRLMRYLTRTAGDTKNCAGLVMQNGAGAVLLVRREPGDTRPGQWEFPGGHIRDGESAIQGAARECREELGGLPDGIEYLLSIESPIGEGATYTNVFVTTSDEAYEPELNSEHDRWGWFTADDLPDDVNPGCLKALEDGPFATGGPEHECSSTHEIDDLAGYLMAEWGDEGPRDESAAGMAIRILQEALT